MAEPTTAAPASLGAQSLMEKAIAASEFTVKLALAEMRRLDGRGAEDLYVQSANGWLTPAQYAALQAEGHRA